MNERGEGNYRLPTEAEWEYSARAGSTTAFANGDITDTSGYNPALELIAWYYANSYFDPHPVAQKEANSWGLFDMHGNVSEWVQDLYGDYPDGPVTDPTGNIWGYDHVHRGGDWIASPAFCRSAMREYATYSSRSIFRGFRLVRDLP